MGYPIMIDVETPINVGGEEYTKVGVKEYRKKGDAVICDVLKQNAEPKDGEPEFEVVASNYYFKASDVIPKLTDEQKTEIGA